MDKINRINEVISQYFQLNGGIGIIPAKDLMPYFIKAGIFEKDEKNGLPIRNVLRNLNKANALHRIPYVVAERKNQNTFWFFSRTAQPASVVKAEKATVTSTSHTTSKRSHSDEHYIIDLCDEVLDIKGSRQHRFHFLRGDAGTTLPVDVYYQPFKLVVEYLEPQHTKAVEFFDKPDKLTASGVPRSEQRRLYDERRKKVLPENGIALLALSYSSFSCNSKGKLLRNKTEDLVVVKKALEALLH